MNIKKAVITVAGLGTRLLFVTKEMPKEMLPLSCMGFNGDLLLKPVLQLIFEQLYDVGYREFSFIVVGTRGVLRIIIFFTTIAIRSIIVFLSLE